MAKFLQLQVTYLNKLTSMFLSYFLHEHSDDNDIDIV